MKQSIIPNLSFQALSTLFKPMNNVSPVNNDNCIATRKLYVLYNFVYCPKNKLFILHILIRSINNWFVQIFVGDGQGLYSILNREFKEEIY